MSYMSPCVDTNVSVLALPDYVSWLTANLPGRRNLATAGAGVHGAKVLAETADSGAKEGEEIYARASLRYGCARECLVEALGATHAMHLAVGALLGPGATVAIETPGYSPFLQILATIGARVLEVPRRRSQSFGIDRAGLCRALESGATAFIITNAHNPSGALLSGTELREIAELCARFDAWLFVCEIYDPAAFSGTAGWFRRSAFRLASNVIALTSLAKIAGLGQERIGWAVAPVEAAERIRAFRRSTIGDVMPISLRSIAARCAVALEALEQSFIHNMGSREAVVRDWLAAGGKDLPVTRFSWSAFMLLHFECPTASMNFAERLLVERNLLVVPGSFFGEPCDVRIGLGGPLPALAEALEELEMQWRAQQCF